MPEGCERGGKHLDDLETHTGDIALSVAGATETRHENLISEFDFQLLSLMLNFGERHGALGSCLWRHICKRLSGGGGADASTSRERNMVGGRNT